MQNSDKYFSVIFSSNPEDYVKRVNPELQLNWYSQNIPPITSRSLINIDYENSMSVEMGWNPDKREPLDFKKWFNIPDDYKIVFRIHSSTPDEYVLALSEANDYLNPNSPISMTMVK